MFSGAQRYHTALTLITNKDALYVGDVFNLPKCICGSYLLCYQANHVKVALLLRWEMSEPICMLLGSTQEIGASGWCQTRAVSPVKS